MKGETRPRKRICVRSRMQLGGDLSHLAFEDAKQLCYTELAGSLECDDEVCDVDPSSEESLSPAVAVAVK